MPYNAPELVRAQNELRNAEARRVGAGLWLSVGLWYLSLIGSVRTAGVGQRYAAFISCMLSRRSKWLASVRRS